MKLTKYGIIILLVLAISSMIYQFTRPPKAPSFYLGGIQINEAHHHEWTTAVQQVGMNTISVTIYARQGAWNSSNLWWEEANTVIQEIKAAKATGLHVVLIPRIALDHYFDENAFLWHGMIAPKTEAILDEWFERYGNFMTYWAQIAALYQVDVLAMGSELRYLSATQPITELPVIAQYYLNEQQQARYIADFMHFRDQIPQNALGIKGGNLSYDSLAVFLQEQVAKKQQWAREITFQAQADPIATMNQRRAFLLQKWYALIAKVRKSYSGKLTYAANFDNYHEVKFWDKLDFIGINAYFQLREIGPPQTRQAQYEEMTASWEKIFSDLDSFRVQEGLLQKALFTELGYIYRENCAIMPWKGFDFSIGTAPNNEKHLFIWKDQKLDAQERALAVKALHKVNQQYDLLKGILYWKLTTKAYQLPIEPFALQLKTVDIDPLQASLLSFMKKETH